MMRFDLDTAANSAYLKIKKGRVFSTEDLSDVVLADIDRAGELLGFEFIGRSALEGAERLIAANIHVPAQIRYSVDQKKSFNVETGIEGIHLARSLESLRRFFAFAAEILTVPQSIEKIPERALVILVEPGDPQEFGHLVELAERQIREGRSVIMRPLGTPHPEAPKWEETQIHNIVYKSLQPKWPQTNSEVKLSYFQDSDVLLAEFGSDARTAFPVLQEPFIFLLVDLESQEVQGMLIPAFVSFLERFGDRVPHIVASLRNAQWHAETPDEITDLLQGFELQPPSPATTEQFRQEVELRQRAG